MRRDLTNQRFGRWFVVARAPSRGDHSLWLCRCDCGTEREVWQISLIRGQTTSCGCFHKEIMRKAKTSHGKHQSPEYRVWANMISRCNNPTLKNYSRYGGRGIRVCREWVCSFENFLSDMGKRPSPRHSIERKDNDGNYEPNNCVWATQFQQAQNTSIAIKLEFQGRCQSLRQWSDETGISIEALRNRIKRGWSPEKALSTPNKYFRKAR